MTGLTNFAGRWEAIRAVSQEHRVLSARWTTIKSGQGVPMRRLAAFCLGCLCLFAGGNPSSAQDRPSWFDEVFRDRWEYVPHYRQRAPTSRPTVQEIAPPVRRDQGAREETRDGGAKPAIAHSPPA